MLLVETLIFDVVVDIHRVLGKQVFYCINLLLFQTIVLPMSIYASVKIFNHLLVLLPFIFFNIDVHSFRC